MPLWTRPAQPLKKEEGDPDDFKPQTQLVLIRKQLYNRRWK
jgi:hypothetical protein